jgi:DNA-directed RNA polymerase specialized sigma24 family protein
MDSDDGFDEFYQSVFGRLVGQVYLVTGDLGDAEDAVQEAFARASARWSTVRDFNVPEQWVRRVAINLALDGLRRPGGGWRPWLGWGQARRWRRSRSSGSLWLRRCRRCPAATGR